MSKIKLLALFGESSAGKDSIQHWLEHNLKNTHGIVSYTTRPPREYEIEGREYHFISDIKFKTLIESNKMLEYTKFNNWYYGTYINELDKNKINIGVFNPEGIRNILSHNDIDILPVWIKVSEKTRLLRSLKRETYPNCTEICRRFLADQKDFSNIDFNYEIFLNEYGCNDYHCFLNRPKISDFIKGQN